jgi:Protein of unknown function (DUF3105)
MASRKEQKEALRAERERKAAEAAAAERRKRMIGFGAAGVLVAAALIAIVVVVLASGGDDGGGDSGGENRAAEPDSADFQKASIPKAQATNLDQAAKAAKCTVKTFPAEGRNHVDGHVDYKTNPPTSGNHFEIPSEDGAYTEAPPMEHLVHSMEHGRVILWFQPTASPQLKGQMKALFDEDNFHMLLAPNTRDMPSQVAASSWTRSVTCPKVNDKTWDALRLFRDRYRDQGPEQVP